MCTFEAPSSTAYSFDTHPISTWHLLNIVPIAGLSRQGAKPAGFAYPQCLSDLDGYSESTDEVFSEVQNKGEKVRELGDRLGSTFTEESSIKDVPIGF